MKKNYFVDTNVLISNPLSIKKLINGVENRVFIPFSCFSELNKLKGKSTVSYIIPSILDEIEKNSEHCKILPRVDDVYKLTGVEIIDVVDNFILKEILESKIKDPVFVTNDKWLRIQAEQVYGIKSQEFKDSNPFKSESQRYSGFVNVDEGEPLETNCFYWREGKMFYNKQGKEKAIDYDNSVWKLEPRTPYQNAMMELLLDDKIDLVTVQSEAGFGKAQPLDSKILTPDGYVRMGDLKIGDKIFNRNGSEQSILGIFPQGKKKIFGVTFSDKSYTECCEEHLWVTQSKIQRDKHPETWHVRELKDLFNIPLKTDSYFKETPQLKRNNIFIPVTESVDFKKKELPLHPYLLGVLIGDGCLSGNSVQITSNDEQIIDDCRKVLPDNCEINKITAKFMYIVKMIKRERNIVFQKLKDLNLCCKSSEKHIPKEYLLSSIDDRLALLRGLMDTDGCIEKKGTLSFCTTSKQLKDDVLFLIRSLGGITKIYEKPSRYKKNNEIIFTGTTRYDFVMTLPKSIIPFKLKRKVDLYTSIRKNNPNRAIIKIEEIGEKECQCIYVSGDHTYLTDDFIVTHNTYTSIAAAMQLLMTKEENRKYKKIFVFKSNYEIGNELGFLPGPQPLTAKVLTPTGWTTMGELNIGDYVIGNDGLPAKVLKTFDKGIKSIFKIETTNGGNTKACGDHVWAVKNNNDLKHKKDFRLLSTLDIQKDLINKNSGDKYNFSLPTNKTVIFNSNKKLPIPPYTLGVILGDGSISNSISFTSMDDDLIVRVKKELQEYGMTLKRYGINYTISGKYENNKPAKLVKTTNLKTGEIKTHHSIGKCSEILNINKSTIAYRCKKNSIIDNIKYEFLEKERWTNYIKNELFKLGLESKKALNKFIPDIYKYTSIENRVALIQGLMDTDGTIKKNGEQVFTSISKDLANDVIEVTRSLGVNSVFYTRNRIGKTTIHNGHTIETKHMSYEVSIPKSNTYKFFYIERKQERISTPKKIFHNKIKNIEYLGEEYARCIQIDNDSHLYITDDFIVTHNTIEDKTAPYFRPIRDLTLKLHEIKPCNRLFIDPKAQKLEFDPKKFEMMPINFIRGLNIENAIVILSEGQNLSRIEMRSFLSRMGENVKCIVEGDVNQIDNPHLSPDNNGINWIVKLMKGKKNYGHVVLSGKNSRGPIADLCRNAGL